MPTTKFQLQSLLDEAIEKTGLNDFGSSEFLPGLTALLESYSRLQFSDKGAYLARKRLLNLLIARLKIEKTWHEHPEILDLEIKAPMFLTGLPRTGTSALLNVLSNDPATRTLKLWEGLHPYPNDESVTESGEDPRYARIKAQYERLNEKSDFKKIHFTSADTPEECIHLTNHTFSDPQFGTEMFLEPYASFHHTVDRRPQYEYHRDLLKMIQWQRPGDRWLLKAPTHIGNLDILNNIYPDASIIVTHRNPLNVIGSYCSMALKNINEMGPIDNHELGARVLEFWASEMENSLLQRESITKESILDLQYTDFVKDNAAFVEKIYDYFSMDYNDAARQAIGQYIADNPANKHGSHDYSLAKFGLDGDKVLDRFSTYIKHFDIKV